MKKIDMCVKNAVANLKPFRGNNTECKFVNHENDDNYTFQVVLHGHDIFAITRKCGTTHYRFSTCGWDTPTTRSRLNACADGLGLPLCFGIRNYVMHWFLDGENKGEYNAIRDMGEFSTITDEDIRLAYTTNGGRS